MLQKQLNLKDTMYHVVCVTVTECINSFLCYSALSEGVSP